MNAVISNGGLTAAPSKAMKIAYWTVTGILSLQLAFTAYGQLRMPEVASAFSRLGFPDYFRVELGWAKLFGVAVLLAPVPARLKEWAYCGFAITLASALYAHLAMGEGFAAWSWAAGTGVLWGGSYALWRRIRANLS